MYIFRQSETYITAYNIMCRYRREVTDTRLACSLFMEAKRETDRITEGVSVSSQDAQNKGKIK